MKMKDRDRGNFIVLGDGDDHVPRSVGVLAAIEDDQQFKDKKIYRLAGPGGEEVKLAGSGAIDAKIRAADIRHFLELDFRGWDTNKNGKFKVIDVKVSEEAFEDPDDVPWEKIEDPYPFG